ncbi:MAG: hypothetical protein EOO75_16375, partial [Myxococcales bacterium]
MARSMGLSSAGPPFQAAEPAGAAAGGSRALLTCAGGAGPAALARGTTGGVDGVPALAAGALAAGALVAGALAVAAVVSGEGFERQPAASKARASRTPSPPGPLSGFVQRGSLTLGERAQVATAGPVRAPLS